MHCHFVQFRGISYKTTRIKVHQMLLNITLLSLYYFQCIWQKDHAVWLSTHHAEVVYTYTALKYNYSFSVLFHNTCITFPSLSQKVQNLSDLLEFSLYLQHNLNLCCCIKCPTCQNDERSVASPPRTRSLLNLEDVDFARVFQRLSPVAEPNAHNLSVIV